MYNPLLHKKINSVIQSKAIDIAGKDNLFYTRFVANAAAIDALFYEIYGECEKADDYFMWLLSLITDSYLQRSELILERDDKKMKKGNWILSNEITGMCLYVDRFCGTIKELENKLDYFSDMGVNLLHLMPLFESPENESDGGYAVSDFRKVDKRFGSLSDLRQLQKKMLDRGMYLMLDIVLNHTSHLHQWAIQARKGEEKFQKYYYIYNDRKLPDQFDASMPEIFPESSPGNFTYLPELDKWVMTVFHHYQWDLNYTNPEVFLQMLNNIFFYANLGVDILRIDAPAFIWKQPGTTCQNLPKAHTVLRLIRQSVQIATPGMALLGEAIVSPSEIMKYFGTGLYAARECDLAYNATHMALQWDALATSDIRVMLAAQHEILQKPFGTTWITYTRCHDDIGLGYEDYMIKQSGFEPFEHRRFLKDFYSGNHPNSPAKGALFSVNPKTNDARISGSLASLCGLERAIEVNDEIAVDYAIRRIIMMQAHSFFIGGIPMLFYGDEAGYTNDYSYLNEPGKNYDNRWMHRPIIDWKKNKKVKEIGSIEHKIYIATRRLIGIRRKTGCVADFKNLTWLTPHNKHIAGYLRTFEDQKLYCLFNFLDRRSSLTWHVFREHGKEPSVLFDLWEEKKHTIGKDEDYLEIEPYQFLLLQAQQS